MSTGPADSDLVLLMRRRQPGAFDEVYRRHRERIWRFLYRLAGAKALAEDLFQDTWLAAARNAHRLREDTQLLPWLYTIARNKHRNNLRQLALHGRRDREVASTPPPAAPPPDTAADLRAEAARVTAAFPQLPEAHREVLLLCLGEGLDGADAARVLGLKPEALRKRLSRARSALARLADIPRAVAGGGHDE